MEKVLRRSKDKILAGVCGGIANYLGWDLTLVRVAYVSLSVFTAGFPGFFLYLILWAIMPVEE